MQHITIGCTCGRWYMYEVLYVESSNHSWCKDDLLSLILFPQVRQIESFLPERRQNLMFSATIPPRVERMAIQLMKEPLYTVIGKVHTCMYMYVLLFIVYTIIISY
jgi:hypothetical protein